MKVFEQGLVYLDQFGHEHQIEAVPNFHPWLEDRSTWLVAQAKHGMSDQRCQTGV